MSLDEVKLLLGNMLKSKAFNRYMQTEGVRAYKHFAKVNEAYIPTLADAATFKIESIGAKACKDLGFLCTSSCHVVTVPDSCLIGVSKLAEGKSTKSTKDLSIQLWLEDIGMFGFSTSQLREEMDMALGEGWFARNVEGLITLDKLKHNRIKELNDLENIWSA